MGTRKHLPRLRIIRKSKQRSLADLAESTNISRATLSRAENAKPVTPKHAAILAQALQTPLKFLEQPLNFDEQEFVFRSHEELPGTVRETIAAILSVVGERQLDQGASSKLLVEIGRTEDPKVAAKKAREIVGIPFDTPIKSLVEFAESAGLILLGFENAPGSFFSASGQARSLGVIGLNAGPHINGGRFRFSLGVEIGYLTTTTRMSRIANKQVARTRAYQFSQELLFPSDWAVSKFGSAFSSDEVDWNRLVEIKEEIGISLSAQLYVAKDCGLLGQDKFDLAQQNLESLGFANEPGFIEREVISPEKMIRL